jgi:NodT family efflux transporter outer membrane factor (OMF) lipoprotein
MSALKFFERTTDCGDAMTTARENREQRGADVSSAISSIMRHADEDLCAPLPSALHLRSSVLTGCGFAMLTLAASLFFTGCKVGPDYHRPAPLGTNALPATFSSATNATEWKPATPSAHLPHGAWWQVFAEPELDRLENLANSQNQELAAALARFEQARASVKGARADLWPQLQLDPSYTRQRTSYYAPQSGAAARARYIYNNFTLPLQASWELDLWGRVRRQVEAARAELTGSADDLQAVKLALQAELAAEYFTLRALDSEYELLQRSVETYRRSLDLTVNRRRGGIATDLDVSEAETQLRTTEAALPALQIGRASCRERV